VFADWPYSSPLTPDWWADRLDAVHGLPPVADVLTEHRCCGVSRFCDGGEERPDRLLTCSWAQSGVWVEAVQAWSAWGSPGPRQLPPVSRWSAWVPRCLLPRLLRGWPAAVRSFAGAPSCDRMAGFGGLMCHHTWVAPAESGCVGWVWPDEGKDCRQWRLINAYRWLRLVGWVLSWRSPPLNIKPRRTTSST
jgi:hypothetical protein